MRVGRLLRHAASVKRVTRATGVGKDSEKLVQQLRAGGITNGPHGRPKLQEANSMVGKSWRSWRDPNEVARVLRALVGSYRDEGSTPDPAVCLDMLAYLEEHMSEITDLPGLVHSVGFISTPVGVLQDVELCAARDKFLEKAFDRLKRRHSNQWKRMDLPLVAAVKNYRPQYRGFIMAVLDTAARELEVEYGRQHSNLADSLTRLPVFLHAYAVTGESGHAVLNVSVNILSNHMDQVPFWVLTHSTSHLATIAAHECNSDLLKGFFWQLKRLECTEMAELAREIFAFYTALWRLNQALQEEDTEVMRRWIEWKLKDIITVEDRLYFDGFALENLCVLLSTTKLEAAELLEVLNRRVVDEDIGTLSPPALIQCLRLLSGISMSASESLQRRLADHISRVQWLSVEAIMNLATCIEDSRLCNRLGNGSEGLVRLAGRELFRSLFVIDEGTLQQICVKLRIAMDRINSDECKFINSLIVKYSDEHDT